MALFDSARPPTKVWTDDRAAQNGAAAEVTASAPLLARYRAALDTFRAGLNDQFARRGMTFLTTSTAVPFDRLVLTVLRARGVVR